MCAHRTLFACSILLLAGELAAAQTKQAASKPLTESGIVQLIDLGIDDAAIVARIEKGGITFAVDDTAVERLNKAGATDAVLAAVKKAGKATQKKPARKAQGKAVSYNDVLALLKLGLDEDVILKRLEQSPTVFTLSADQVKELKEAGATQRVLDALTGKRARSGGTGDVTDIAIVLDCSGSMMEKTQEGQTKMAVAKAVVTDLIQKIPDGLRLTFIVYGHDKELRCEAVKIVRALEEIDAAGKSELAGAISSLQPSGATPIALALRTAGKELAKNDAYCGLVLISDGKETCKGDPAAEAETLAGKLKLSFGVNVVGFDVGEDRASLEEIAKRGKGQYFNADSASELSEAMQKLRKELEQKAAPLKQRETRQFAAAGKAVKPGAFLNDAPVIEPGEYKGTLAFLEAHYYQIPVRTGQEIRAVGIIRKTPYQGYNNVENQTFAITLYKESLEVAAKEGLTVKGNPTAPVSVRAIWTADYDGLLYIAISASDNHDSPDKYGEPIGAYEPKEPKPSAYTLRIRRDGDAEAGEALPRLQSKPGNGFDQAAELTVPGMASADLKLGEVVFYRVPAEKGEQLQLALAAQKPWYQNSNRTTRARYVLTLYDDDQVQVAQKSFDVEKNPPDAHSLVMRFEVELSGSVYLGVSCENSGQQVYLPKEGPRPGRIALQVRATDASADKQREDDKNP